MNIVLLKEHNPMSAVWFLNYLENKLQRKLLNRKNVHFKLLLQFQNSNALLFANLSSPCTTGTQNLLLHFSLSSLKDVCRSDSSSWLPGTFISPPIARHWVVAVVTGSLYVTPTTVLPFTRVHGDPGNLSHI